MAGAREEQVENHWPGYVDALTTMLMVLTFVMMILGIAVFAMSQNTSRILLEQIAKAARIDIPDGSESPVADLADRVLKELERPRLPLPTQPPGAGASTGSDTPAPPVPQAERPEAAAARIMSSAPAHAGAPAPGRLGSQAAEALIITFQPRATRLDDAALRDLDAAIRSADALAAAQGARLLARVDLSAGAVSDARRVAYYRAMLVRARLVDAGLPAPNIRIRLVEQPDDGVAPESVRIEPAAPESARGPEGQP